MTGNETPGSTKTKRPRAKAAEAKALKEALQESATLRKSPEHKAQVAAELAALCRTWRAKAEIPASRAAQLLGVPKRTYENIEQGRGFPYPNLLVLALKAFD